MGIKYSWVIFIIKTTTPCKREEIFQQNPEEFRDKAQYKITGLKIIRKEFYLGQNLILVILPCLFLFLQLLQVLVVAYRIQFPDQGLNLGPLHWEPGVLATGPPGKSQLWFYCNVHQRAYMLHIESMTPQPFLFRMRFKVEKLPWLYQGFHDSLVGKESICNAGDPCSIPGLGRSPEEGKGYPLQYSGLENSMDCLVHGVTKSRTRLSNLHFKVEKASLVAQLVKNPPAMRETWVWSLGWEKPLEKGTTSHSSTLAWRTPWTVQSMGSQRVGHD